MSAIQLHSRTLHDDAFLIKEGEFRPNRCGYQRELSGDPLSTLKIGQIGCVSTQKLPVLQSSALAVLGPLGDSPLLAPRQLMQTFPGRAYAWQDRVGHHRIGHCLAFVRC